MIYFWSDTHFNHRNIIKYCNRPYANIDEMNWAMIQAWNSTVGAKDSIYLVGDFAFVATEGIHTTTLFNTLNGDKHLVVGNHDERNSEVLKLPWSSISNIAWIKHNNHRAMVCHYPMESWKSSHHGSLMIHGHCHGSLKRVIPHRFDVGVDVFSRPVSFDELCVRAETQRFEASDHHAE